MVGVSATSLPTTATSNPFDCGAFANHAFLWREGMVIDLGTLSGVGNCSGAKGINSHGVIVANSDTGEIDPLEGFTQSHAVQWRDGHITDLRSLRGGYESVAVSINHQDLVVGISTNRVSDPLGCFGLGVQCRGVSSGVLVKRHDSGSGHFRRPRSSGFSSKRTWPNSGSCKHKLLAEL